MSEKSDRRPIADGVNAVIGRAHALLPTGEPTNAPDLRRLLLEGEIVCEPRWVVDTAALPEELAAKVVAREKVFGPFPPAPLAPGYRVDPSRDSPWDMYILMLAVPLVLFVCAAIGAGLTGPIAIGLICAPCVSLLVSLGIVVRKYRGPLALTKAEVHLVDQHTTTIDPSQLQHPYRYMGRSRSVQSFEDALHVAAIEVISEIAKSPAWKCEHGDLHRIQLNLAEEAYQVTESCINLGKLRELINEALPIGTSSSAARRQLESTVAEYEILYQRAKEAVINRIAALYAYKSRLAGIETLISDIDKAAALSRRSDDFTATFETIVRDEYAAANTRILAADLADLQARLQTELAFISGQIIEAPALAAPLARADTPVHQPSQANAK